VNGTVGIIHHRKGGRKWRENGKEYGGRRGTEESKEYGEAIEESKEKRKLPVRQ
jgi:hypothetical protein